LCPARPTQPSSAARRARLPSRCRAHRSAGPLLIFLNCPCPLVRETTPSHHTLQFLRQTPCPGRTFESRPRSPPLSCTPRATASQLRAAARCVQHHVPCAPPRRAPPCLHARSCSRRLIACASPSPSELSAGIRRLHIAKVSSSFLSLSPMSPCFSRATRIANGPAHPRPPHCRADHLPLARPGRRLSSCPRRHRVPLVDEPLASRACRNAVYAKRI
jgi:hypothetical protein